jgi:predicted dehydrogenase
MSSVGVIGAGYWGPNLIRNFFTSGHFNEVIACDRDPKRIDAICKLIPGIKGCTDVEELLNNPKVEAVAIATPVRWHYELAKAALNKGKHVLIEKPLTQSSTEAKELIDLAASKKLTLMVDHTFLFNGAVEKIRDIIASGELGECYYVDSVRVNLGLFQHDVDVIWDLAPHDLSIVSHCLKATPTVIRAIGRPHAGHPMVDVAYLNIEYKEGFSANFHVNWLSPTKIRKMIVAGSKKMIVWDDMEPADKIRVFDKGVEIKTADDVRNVLVQYRTGDVSLPRLDGTEALKKMTGHFVDCYRNGKTPICSGQDGLDVVKVLEASQISLKSGGRAVSIADGKIL